MNDDFGVGLGREPDAFALELAAQFGKILDDAVVHDGDFFSGVRMRVVLGWAAMRGPTGMTDADRAGKRLAREPVLQILELALGAPPHELAVLQRGDAGGIVAAIFEALERIDQ